MRLSENTRKWLPWLLLALAVVVTAIVYWPGLTGGWVFDDYPNIVDNAAIHITPGHSTLAAWVNAALSSPASFLHRPLASITFALNWYAGGGDPWPFKLTNVVIHLVNGVLVFFMLRALLRVMALRRPQFEPLSRRERGWGEGTGTRRERHRATPNPHPPLGAPSPGGRGGLENHRRSRRDPARAGRQCRVDAVADQPAGGALRGATDGKPVPGLRAGRLVGLPPRSLDDADGDRCASRPARFRIGRERHHPGHLLGLTSKESAVLLPAFAFLAEWILLRFARTRQFRRPPPAASTDRASLQSSPSGGGHGWGWVRWETQATPSHPSH